MSCMVIMCAETFQGSFPNHLMVNQVLKLTKKITAE